MSSHLNLLYISIFICIFVTSKKKQTKNLFPLQTDHFTWFLLFLGHSLKLQILCQTVLDANMIFFDRNCFLANKHQRSMNIRKNCSRKNCCFFLKMEDDMKNVIYDVDILKKHNKFRSELVVYLFAYWSQYISKKHNEFRSELVVYLFGYLSQYTSKKHNEFGSELVVHLH